MIIKGKEGKMIELIWHAVHLIECFYYQDDLRNVIERSKEWIYIKISINLLGFQQKSVKLSRKREISGWTCGNKYPVISQKRFPCPEYNI